jgi:hypothetical protein
MDSLTVVGLPRRLRLAWVAIIGALLGQLAVALPAQSGDWPGPYHPYAPGPYYSGYHHGCCGRHLVERRVIVEREYIERRYVAPYHHYHHYGCGCGPPCHYGHGCGPPCQYGHGCGSPCQYGAYGYDRGPFPYGYGGVRYLPPPVSYDYENDYPYHPSYGYEPRRHGFGYDGPPHRGYYGPPRHSYNYDGPAHHAFGYGDLSRNLFGFGGVLRPLAAVAFPGARQLPFLAGTPFKVDASGRVGPALFQLGVTSP